MANDSARPGSSPKVPKVDSLMEFWSALTEVEAVLAGFEPLARAESEWSSQPEAIQGAIAVVAKWALRQSLYAWLHHWCCKDPLPSESLNHQVERGRLYAAPGWRAVLDDIDKEVRGHFEILGEPRRSDLARDALLMACNVRQQISENTILIRLGEEM